MSVMWWDDPQAPTPPLDEFLKQYRANSNVWWYAGSGHGLNLFDDAVDQLEQARLALAKVRAVADRWIEYGEPCGESLEVLLDSLDVPRTEVGE